MSATPVAADHSEEFEELAGLSALRILEPEEQARFDQHAAHCERCRMIVRLDEETLAGLALTAPEMDPSPGFRERLLERAAAELAERPVVQEAPEPIPLRPQGRILQFRRNVWASALAAVLVIGIATAGAAQYMNQVVASYTAQGGGMTVLVKRSGAVELQMEGMADPPPGFVYEAWVIPPGQQPVAAGVTPRGEARLPLPGDARGSTIAITLERGPNGASAPTSTPLAAVNVPA
jgi:anti-sigma-K factor RskA